MPVNLNPPPLPTPESARSVQSSQPVDEPQASDLFAQLVAAAAIPQAPASMVAVEAKGGEDKSRDGEAPRADAPPTDWMLALGALPIAAPVIAPVELARVRVGDDATARAPAPRIARAARPDADAAPAAEAKRDNADALAALDPQRGVASAALREQIAAALAPRAHAQPSPTAQPLVAKDAAARDVRADATAAATLAPPPAPLAAALAAAVEQSRGPAAAAHDTAPRVEPGPIAATALSAPAPSSAAAPAIIVVHTPVAAPGFGDEVAAKLAHVVLRHDRAELRLSPAELGPVDIRIDFRNDSASLTIVAAQPATREALEQALPQLRESLAAQGIALGQAAINDGRAQPERHPDPSAPSSPRVAASDDVAAPAIVARTLRLSDRLIDTFA